MAELIATMDYNIDHLLATLHELKFHVNNDDTALDDVIKKKVRKVRLRFILESFTVPSSHFAE